MKQHSRRTAISPAMLDIVAERFKVLGEPARLWILQTLMCGESTVSELIETTGLGQANVSKHLQMLYTSGFVDRRKEGLYVWYRLADQSVFQLCEIMCGQIERKVSQQYRKISQPSRRMRGGITR